jgi:hypothetical protein
MLITIHHHETVKYSNVIHILARKHFQVLPSTKKKKIIYYSGDEMHAKLKIPGLISDFHYTNDVLFCLSSFYAPVAYKVQLI